VGFSKRYPIQAAGSPDSYRDVNIYKILITCRCRCPGARTIANLPREPEHLPAGRQESKKCGKQLIHIVCVMASDILFI